MDNCHKCAPNSTSWCCHFAFQPLRMSTSADWNSLYLLNFATFKFTAFSVWFYHTEMHHKIILELWAWYVCATFLEVLNLIILGCHCKPYSWSCKHGICVQYFMKKREGISKDTWWPNKLKSTQVFADRPSRQPKTLQRIQLKRFINKQLQWHHWAVKCFCVTQINGMTFTGKIFGRQAGRGSTACMLRGKNLTYPPKNSLAALMSCTGIARWKGVEAIELFFKPSSLESPSYLELQNKSIFKTNNNIFMIQSKTSTTNPKHEFLSVMKLKPQQQQKRSDLSRRDEILTFG